MTAAVTLLSTQKPLPLHNAFRVRQQIRYYDEATDTWLPWLGDAATVRFSLTTTGYDANGYPSTVAGPYPLVLTGVPGVYGATIVADDVMTYFGNKVGTVIYQVVEGAYGSNYYDLTDVQPLLVIDPRAP